MIPEQQYGTAVSLEEVISWVEEYGPSMRQKDRILATLHALEESMTPVEPDIVFGFGGYDWRCSKCETVLVCRGQNFCQSCGKKIVWRNRK